MRPNPDLQKVVTNVGPDQQDQAKELAKEHAQKVADDAAKQQQVIRGDIKPPVQK